LVSNAEFIDHPPHRLVASPSKGDPFTSFDQGISRLSTFSLKSDTEVLLLYNLSTGNNARSIIWLAYLTRETPILGYPGIPYFGEKSASCHNGIDLPK
jgi:hypothetical protein